MLARTAIARPVVDINMSKQHPKNESETTLVIVNPDLEFPRVSLVEPTDSHYIHLAATIDDPLLSLLPVYLSDSDEKQTLVSTCKRLCANLADTEGVIDATVFKAVLRPPGGGGDYLERTEESVHVADFDLAVLVEVENEAALERLDTNQTYCYLESAMKDAARVFHRITGAKERRIGPVAHDGDGVFLFNYFFAEDIERNVQVWEYTAGWFQSETGLDNSVLIVPDDPQESEYTIINHCRWDTLRDVLAALVVRQSFQSYVLANFAANNVAPMPILYKIA